MRNAKNILRHELIGLGAKVVEASDENKVGVSGQIVDETRSMLVLRTEKGEKKVEKKDAVVELALPTEKVRVDGALLVGRPEDRLKKKLAKDWSRGVKIVG